MKYNILIQITYTLPFHFNSLTMKDFSLILLKNYLMRSKIGKGVRNFCNNNDSISTLNQCSSSSSNTYTRDEYYDAPPRKSVTLEEMIMQLDMEEEMARRDRQQPAKIQHRMSCVNSSDILRSATSALNQNPRFSLDGREAMYMRRKNGMEGGLKLGKILHLPKSVGGESVVWCKPGVVAKLMGLDAMPVPVNNYNYKSIYDSTTRAKEMNVCNAIMRNHRLRRQKRHATNHGYCVMNPIAVEPVWGLGGPMSSSWPSPNG